MGERPVIIGFGPAGMFAALELLACGHKPLIFERGKRIEERDGDVQGFIRDRMLDPESNIQFGEGGAGSYSDGKLFSRINNSAHANKVLDTFIKFGAPEEIKHSRKPHLGTDVLCRIVRNIRAYVLERGGEIHYASRLTDLVVSEGSVAGVVINGEHDYLASHLYLAIGHSARDTFTMLHEKGVALEQKPISVGVRIEHPAELINRIRYDETGGEASAPGAATYSFNHTNRKTGRGAYTFCMCPGGEIVNASSEAGLLVLNGMSYSRRASAFSNSALVVSCHTDDYPSAHPLAGIEFQRGIERKAFEAGGGGWNAPAQNLVDFLGGKASAGLNRNSFKMGVTPVDLNAIFPEFVGTELRCAFSKWHENYPLFVSEQAILLAAETRTSSPVRITRNEKGESVNMGKLYPIGEGSGYTGGITSSAIDAIKAVERTMSNEGRRSVGAA
ncbi:MAG: dehydrogenase [bacterium]